VLKIQSRGRETMQDFSNAKYYAFVYALIYTSQNAWEV
jgi:hypothetical protein